MVLVPRLLTLPSLIALPGLVQLDSTILPVASKSTSDMFATTIPCQGSSIWSVERELSHSSSWSNSSVGRGGGILRMVWSTSA